MSAPLLDTFRAARRDRSLVVLEGLHAVKHALRFGAQLERVVAADDIDVHALAAQLAPELAPALERAERITAPELAALVPRAPRTGILAIAQRPEIDTPALLASRDLAPIVLLELPRTMGNLGACIRVAAAAGAAGVLTTGPHDPWHPDAVRGAAGLQFALPVARWGAAEGDSADAISEIAAAARASDRPLLALDPHGAPLRPGALPPRAILAFGTEREGLSAALLDAATQRLALPMQPGVSSLNLATSVAAVLYAWRLGTA